jgi:hypothetical protein
VCPRCLSLWLPDSFSSPFCGPSPLECTSSLPGIACVCLSLVALSSKSHFCFAKPQLFEPLYPTHFPFCTRLACGHRQSPSTLPNSTSGQTSLLRVAGSPACSPSFPLWPRICSIIYPTFTKLPLGQHCMLGPILQSLVTNLFLQDGSSVVQGKFSI